MVERKLDKEILSILVRKTGRAEKTIRNDISSLRGKFGSLPINTVAQIYALQNGGSIRGKLTKEEKKSLPNLDIVKPMKIVQKNPKGKKAKNIVKFINYETTDRFIKAHIIEVNKAYTFSCYTAAFILCRKILENLLTDIIKKKFPQNKKENIELYFDISKGRTKDFSDIITNLRKHSKEFGPDKNLVERILNRANQFKDDANNKTHSWYHVVRIRKELDDTHVQDIIDMIVTLEKNMNQQNQPLR